MRKLLLSLLCILWQLTVFAQIEIKDFDTKDFPTVSFSIKSYDPVLYTVEQARVLEEDTLVSITNFESMGVPFIPAIKNVLFVWDLRGKESFVPELLFDFFNGMCATSQTSDSLFVNVAVFGRDEEDKPVYSPLFSSFTSDLQGMRDRVVEEAEKELTEKAEASDIIWALMQAVGQIKAQPANVAKAIVLFTNGKNNLNSGFETTPLVNQARENRIQIYTVNIAGGEMDETLCKVISSRTYGSYLVSEGSFETKEQRMGHKDMFPFLFAENDIVKEWVSDLSQHWAGNSYRVSFESRYERVGQSKEIKVWLGDESVSNVYHLPKYTFGNWIKDNFVFSLILLFVIVAGAVVGLYFLIRHLRYKADERREEEEEFEAERKKLKSEQENLKRKLDYAEYEQRKKQEQERAKEKTFQHQEQLDAINSIMCSRNVKARLLVSMMTGAFEFLASSAENTIGSAEDNDIVIDDRTVSRHHAILYYNGQTFCIRDLKSTNGIVMNGFKIDDLKLRNGDSISLGNVVMKIYF